MYASKAKLRLPNSRFGLLEATRAIRPLQQRAKILDILDQSDLDDPRRSISATIVSKSPVLSGMGKMPAMMLWRITPLQRNLMFSTAPDSLTSRVHMNDLTTHRQPHAPVPKPN